MTDLEEKKDSKKRVRFEEMEKIIEEVSEEGSIEELKRMKENIKKKIKEMEHKQQILETSKLYRNEKYGGPTIDFENKSDDARCWLKYKENRIVVIDLNKYSCPDVNPNTIQVFHLNGKTYYSTFIYSYSSLISLEKAEQLIVWQPPNTNILKIDVSIPTWWDYSIYPYIFEHRSYSPLQNSENNEDSASSPQELIESTFTGQLSNESDESISMDIPVIIPIPVNRDLKVYSILYYDYWSTNSYQNIIQFTISSKL